jgi:hypothetical protein
VRLAAAISQAMANGRRVDEKPEGAKRLGVGLVRYASERSSTWKGRGIAGSLYHFLQPTK